MSSWALLSLSLALSFYQHLCCTRAALSQIILNLLRILRSKYLNIKHSIVVGVYRGEYQGQSFQSTICFVLIQFLNFFQFFCTNRIFFWFNFSCSCICVYTCEHAESSACTQTIYLQNLQVICSSTRIDANIDGQQLEHARVCARVARSYKVTSSLGRKQ